MERERIKSLQQFHLVSWAEGVSLLVLLFFAMPLKYIYGYEMAVKYVGWIHGLLFIAYLLVGLRTAIKCKWSFLKVVLAVIASLLPFGPMIFDRSVKREIHSLRMQLAGA